MILLVYLSKGYRATYPVTDRVMTMWSACASIFFVARPKIHCRMETLFAYTAYVSPRTVSTFEFFRLEELSDMTNPSTALYEVFSVTNFRYHEHQISPQKEAYIYYFVYQSLASIQTNVG